MARELLLTAYERGWNLHDADVCASCFTPDATRETRIRRGRRRDGAPAPAPAQGREAIRAEIATILDSVADLRVEVLAAGYASDRRLWTEWRVTGTCTGSGPGGSRTGADAEILGVSVFRLSNAGFREERTYWDSGFIRS